MLVTPPPATRSERIQQAGRWLDARLVWAGDSLIADTWRGEILLFDALLPALEAAS